MPLSPDYIIRKLEELPVERGLKVLPGRQRAFLKCSWHTLPDGRPEETSSFMVHIGYDPKYPQGTGFCFGCGKRIKSFQTILDPTRPEDEIPEAIDEEFGYIQHLHNQAVSLRLYGNGDKPPFDLGAAMPWLKKESWRTIPGPVMAKIKAQSYFDLQFRLMMAYLPCYVHGEHVGGIRARLHKSENKQDSSYYNTTGSWVREDGLFPFDQTAAFLKKKNLKTLVLVEGPRDALRSLSFGIPTDAILGTNNWSETKAEHIYNLGVKRVLTAFDPDNAGKKATKDVYNSFRQEIDVKQFDLAKYHKYYREHHNYTEKQFDPGNMPIPVMMALKKAALLEI